MNAPANIFFQSFVKPFYKENAGALVFVFTMMFCIVSTMDGAGMFAYHYSLVTSMLTSPVVFVIVFFLWALYARKCALFVANAVYSPQYSFLYIINNLSKAKRFRLFLLVEVWLLMPILLYSLFIVYVGLHQGKYVSLLLVIIYLLLLCIASAMWHLRVLEKGRMEAISLQKITSGFGFSSSYPAMLLRFVANEGKAVWLGTQVFTCGVLYLIARYNSATEYDIVMPFLFFNFGVYANGVLVYNIRTFEETYLSFYRSLPVPAPARFIQYMLVYFILLMPEFITVVLLLPTHLHYNDAVNFSLSAYSLLLLMNSVLFVKDFSTKEYVIVLLALFCIQYMVLPTAGFATLHFLFCLAAAVLFLTSYYRFERNVQKEST